MFTNEEDYYEDLAERSGAVIYGDARRCSVHPGVKTSSDDGMFDGVCHLCEGEMEESRMMWEYDQSNMRRQFCGMEIHIALPRYHSTVACVPSEEDNIPF